MSKLNVPPVWLGIFMLAAWGLSKLWAPLGSGLALVGWALIVAGFALAIWSGLEFRRARTTIVPHERPSALVATGPYRFSRNPIYLADLVILAGVALAVGSPLALVLLVPFYLVLQHLFILPEEAVLEQDLGEDYLAYKAQVRRWA